MTDANAGQRETVHDPSDDSVGIVEFANKYVNKLIAFAGLFPTAVTWKGMPMYGSQRPTLLSLTSLFCILIIGFLFMNRELRTTRQVAYWQIRLCIYRPLSHRRVRLLRRPVFGASKLFDGTLEW